MMLTDLNGRLTERELKIVLTDEAKRFVVDNGYDPVYGARPLKRFLQKHVETLAARLILEDQVHTGDTIVIGVTDKELTARTKK